MAEPVGTVIEVTFDCSMFNQRILNVLHYRVIDQSSTISYVDEMTAFAGIFADQGINGVMTAFQSVVPAQLNIRAIVAQSIYPVRARKVPVPLTLNGNGGQGAIQNIQASITFWNILAGRRYIGGKRVVVPSSLISNGLIPATLKADLTTLADRWTTNIAEVNGDAIYEPVIFHRNPNFNPRAHRIDGFIVQETSRVQRRRTVGLGE